MLADILPALLAGFAGFIVFMVWLIWRAPRARPRHMLKHRPPKGTRPEVRVVIDGITYDVTEQMQRRADRPDGCAVWVIRGPEHVRMAKGSAPLVRVRNPVPLATEVVLMLARVGDRAQARFATQQEIDEDHEPYCGQ